MIWEGLGIFFCLISQLLHCLPNKEQTVKYRVAMMPKGSLLKQSSVRNHYLRSKSKKDSAQGLLIKVSSEDSRDFNYEGELTLTEQQPLFVSLGSTCEPAHMMRFCGFRKVAFPFDWIVSMDGEKLIELLEDDFQYFLNEDHLIKYEFSGALLQTHYHLEFLHEGDWRGNEYIPNMQKLKPKYQRRIERFRRLSNYAGKVFFIRAAYIYSTTDTHRYYKFENNIEITDAYSLRLYNALQNRFPNLNFSLIIVNIHNREGIEEEKKISDNLLMIRANPLLDLSVKISAYEKFFLGLVEQEAHTKQ